MKIRNYQRVCAIIFCALSSVMSFAQQTYQEMEQLTVNENVTTVITAPEPIRLVDISTDKVVGDKPIENVIRVKPKEGGHLDGEVVAIVDEEILHAVPHAFSCAICSGLHYTSGRSCFR